MSNIAIKTIDEVLVVDSRLIAGELGISHKSFIETIRKYQTQAEQAFGILPFQTAEIDGRGQPEKFVYLTEDQSIFYMTLSRNTPQVIACKVNLVKAFSEAKEALRKQSELITPHQKTEYILNQVEKSIYILEVLEQLDERTRILLADRVRNEFILPNNSEHSLTSAQKTEWTVSDRLEYREIRGLDNYQSVIGKKAKKLYKEAQGKEPVTANRLLKGKQRKMTVYIGSEVEFLDVAINEYLDRIK